MNKINVTMSVNNVKIFTNNDGSKNIIVSGFIPNGKDAFGNVKYDLISLKKFVNKDETNNIIESLKERNIINVDGFVKQNIYEDSTGERHYNQEFMIGYVNVIK